MEKNTTTAFLHEMDMFYGIGREDLEDIASKFKLKTYKARQHIFYEGDPGLMMYFIKEGHVCIYPNTPSGREASPVMMNTGQSFGGFTLIDKQFRSANAIATTPTSCYTLNHNAFYVLIEQYPQIARNMMRYLSQHLRSNPRRTETPLVGDIEQQVAQALADMVEGHGIQYHNGQIELNVVILDAHIAHMLGLSRESVNRAFRSLRDLGIVKRSYDSTLITNPDRFYNLIN